MKVYWCNITADFQLIFFRTIHCFFCLYENSMLMSFFFNTVVFYSWWCPLFNFFPIYGDFKLFTFSIRVATCYLFFVYYAVFMYILIVFYFETNFETLRIIFLQILWEKLSRKVFILFLVTKILRTLDDWPPYE